MLDRLIKIIKSFLNSLFETFEDPETILRNNIREMRNQIPKLNEGVIRAAATVKLLTNEIVEYKQRQKQLKYQIQLAANRNEDKVGIEIALELKRIEKNIEKNETALDSAKKGLETIKEIREVTISRIKNEINNIRDSIDNARIAKLKGEVADIFESYDVGSLATTNEEMLDKLDRDSAEQEAKFEDMGDSYDFKLLSIERTVEENEAKEFYKSFKKDKKSK